MASETDHASWPSAWKVEGGDGAGGGAGIGAKRIVTGGRRQPRPPAHPIQPGAVAVRVLQGGGAAGSCCGGGNAGPVDPLSDMLQKTSPQQRAEALAKARQQGLVSKNGKVDARFGVASVTALMQAAENGKADDVMTLLHAGADVFAVDKLGRTSLHLAAENGSLPTARHLLDFGGKRILMATNNRKRTALMDAAGKGHSEVVVALLKRGGNGKEGLMAVDEAGWSALHFAAEKGHSGVVAILTEAGGEELIALQGHAKWNALHAAAANGHVDTVQHLIDVGGVDQVSVKTEKGKRPLDLAMEYRKDAVVSRLAPLTSASPVVGSKGHMTDFPSPSGRSVRSRPTSPEALSPLGVKSPPRSPRRRATSPRMHSAMAKAEKPNPSMVAGKIPSGKALTKKEALAIAKEVHLINPSTFDSGLETRTGKFQQTPLMLAAEQGRDDDVQVLLIGGADAKAAASDGCTPIMFAAKGGCLPALKRLVDHAGADAAKAVSSRGWTALHYAAFAGHADVAGLLSELGGGALLMARDEEGWTPHMRACEKGMLEAVRIMSQHGGHELMLVQGRAGWNALMCASANGHNAVVEHLLEVGPADQILVKSGTGTTALALAEKYKKEETVALINKHINRMVHPDLH